MNSAYNTARKFIIEVLVKYQRLNDTSPSQDKERARILTELESLSPVELLDHFSIVLEHENDFETTYQMIMYQMNSSDGDNSSISSSIHNPTTTLASCNDSRCQMIKRNNRERTTKHQQISQTYYGIKDDAKIVLLQLLDKIHVYFAHSFDFGLKFTKSEATYIFQSAERHFGN